MLVLASASKARKKLLDQIGLSYEVIVSDFDEKKVQELDPCLKVQFLAKEKANNVFKKLIDEKGSQPINALIGCDSLFEFKGEIFGKPRNKEQLINRWKMFSGEIGFLHTGHYLMSVENCQDGANKLSVNDICQGVVSTKIEFMPLRINEIINYSEISEPYQCAGGFAIEGKGGLFIKNIDGCFSNVIGLSLPWLKTNLDKIGLSKLVFRNKNYN